MSLVIISGASQGIGEAIAKKFATSPQHQLILLGRNEERLALVNKNCQAFGISSHHFTGDLSDPTIVHHLAKHILSTFGTPDLIVNNAGKYEDQSIFSMTTEILHRQLNDNLFSAFHLTQAFLPMMIERKSGDLFFIGSVASLIGFSKSVPYCAAKHALLGLTRALREETKNKNIRITNILPAALKTLNFIDNNIKLELDKIYNGSFIQTLVLGFNKLFSNTNKNGYQPIKTQEEDTEFTPK